jgi:hypothetical protein
MAIADKITTIIENTQAAHQAGYNIGYDDGKQDGNEQAEKQFWADFLEDGKRKNYNHLINGWWWTPENFTPPKEYLPLQPETASYIFTWAGNLEIDISEMFDFADKCTSYSNAFNESGITNLGNIDATKSAYHLNFAFMNARKLKSIREIKVRETTTFASAFQNCSSLESVKFVGTITNNLDMKESPLDKDSVENIIGCLSTTAKNKTLTLKASVKNHFTNEEWDNLVTNNKDIENWTITTV